MEDIFRILNTGCRSRRHPEIRSTVCSSADAHPRTDPLSALDFFGDSERQEIAVIDKKIGKRRSEADSSSPSSKKRKESCGEEAAATVPEETFPMLGATPKISEKKKKKKKKEVLKEAEAASIARLEGVEITEPLMFSSSTRQPATKKKTKKLRPKSVQQSSVEAHLEQANAIRNLHGIAVRGIDIPDCVETFDKMESIYSLRPYVLQNVHRSGYSTPTPVQMQAVPLMMMNREILVSAPTGSGKTAAFLIPLLAHLKEPSRTGFRALIVAPTRELAQQTFRELSRLSEGSGFRCHVLTKATSKSFSASSSQRHDILISTPNRLVHLLEQDPPGVDLSGIRWLVLDEADKLFEKGKDSFEDQVATILAACSHGQCCRSLFSATLGNGVEDWCQSYLPSYTRITIGQRGAGADNIKQRLVFVGQEAGKLLEIRQMVKRGFEPPVLIFVQSKERAKALFNELVYDELRVDVIHADRTQAQRDSVISNFRAGKIWVLICTELMGRGIDFKGLNMVINYDFPSSAVNYIHRIGRTGRAGRQGEAVTFFTEDDTVNLRSIVNVMRASGCEVPDWMSQIRKPTKRTRQKLRTQPVKRKSPATAVKYNQETARKRREMVAASKARKERQSDS